MTHTEPCSFSRGSRIKSADDFTAIIRTGKLAVDDTLVCNALPNSQARSRIGISIPKKVGNAVVRNRWKRWLREAFRTQRHLIPEGFDFVVRPRRGAAGTWDAVAAGLVRVTQRSAAKGNRPSNALRSKDSSRSKNSSPTDREQQR